MNLSFRFPGEKPDGNRAILLVRMEFVNPKVRGKRICDLDAVLSCSIRACCLVNAGRL